MCAHLPQMMWPAAEIFRPITFAAPLPHPRLMQPLPSIALLHSEEVRAAANGGAPGVAQSCGAGADDAKSCPAHYQDRCAELQDYKVEGPVKA